MKRIGVLLSAGPGGGVLQYTQSVLDALLAMPDDYELCAATADPAWRTHLPERVSIVALRESAWNRALNRTWHLSRLGVALWRRTGAYLDTNVRALLAAECDLWICPNHEKYSFRAPVPALGTVHDLMHRYESRWPEVSADREHARREFHFAETCRWSRGVLVDSELGKQQLIESYGIEAAKVFTLPYIAPPWIYEYDGGEDAAVRAKYSLPEKFFFYPAQFYRHKNHAALLDAMARLRKSHPDARLVLLGAKERNAYEDVRRQVAQLGLGQNVLFAGYAPDREMAAFYHLARALVMPTYFGPTNIPQLEAFALGCPVATSRIYAIPEQVGDAALLFDPASVDEIHECLVRLWTDDALCADLARRGRAHAEQWGPPHFRARFRKIVEAVT